MKKTFSIFISICILLSTVTTVDFLAFANINGRCGDNITYTFDNNTKTLSLSGTGATYDYEEGSNPFYGNTEIKNIVVDEGITEIGKYFFCNCYNAKDLSLSEGLKTISDGAFKNCKSLELDYIPNGVTVIGSKAFMNTAVKEITLPKSLTELKDMAFNKCYNLEELFILNPYCFIYDISSIDGNGDNMDEYLCIEKQAALYSWEYCYDKNNSSAKQYAERHNMWYSCCGTTHPDEHLEMKLTEQIDQTCTVDGLERYEFICKLCGEVDHRVEYQYISQGHKFDNGKITKKATCMQAGTKTYTCSECHITIKESIPKLVHKYSTKITKATTSKNGKIVKTCSVGKESTATTIYYPKTITLSSTSYTYDGKTRTPTVKIIDSRGNAIPSSNYTVNYGNGRKSVGRYPVKVTFKGNYSGSISKTFDINPKSTIITSIKSPSKKYIVVYWKKASNISGYQVQRSTSRNFKKDVKCFDIPAKAKSGSNKKNIKSDKKYYYRIRTYKKVKYKGKTIRLYSSWSKTKSVKAK